MALYDKHLRCPSCDYFADRNEWTKLRVSSSDGYASLTCDVYDLAKKRALGIGSVMLYSCPHCKTVIWGKY